ncbi:MAG: 16S rRNA (uracil(1498)-N(3))-methyltransferase [Myxococcales bacterium]|nr:16S rRNA (uracil(1498)-N(3))-methyltransferase [Myxococcales bacterium]
MSHRVPAPGADLDAPTIPLPDDAAHHLVHVLRLGVGAPVIVFDAGREVTATLQHADGAWCAQASGPARAGVGGAAVTLAYGLPKGDKLDAVLRQVTELGVQRVVLLDCARSVVRPERRARVEAARPPGARRRAGGAPVRAGRRVPDIEGPRAVAAAAEVLADHTRWVLHPEGGGPIAAAPLGAPLAVFVGPEGGFAPDELAALEGAHRVTLGPRVLRTETAAPVACALALHRLGAL